MSGNDPRRHHDGRPRLGHVAPGLAAVGIGLAVRAGQVWGLRAIWSPDSEKFLALSEAPTFSLERWAGARTPLVPTLLDLTGGEPGTAFVVLQVTIAALAWGLLAGEVAATQPTTRRRWAMAGLVLLFSLTSPITLWDRLVLTETISLALLAAAVALVLRHLRTGATWPLVALLAVAVPWLAGRDTVAVTLVSGSVLAVAAWLMTGRTRRIVPVVAVVLVALSGLAYAGASHGHRGDSPLANVFAIRVMPYPDRIQWFVDHGMPDGERFLSAKPMERPNRASEAPLVPISRKNQDTDPWWRWLRAEGTTTYVRFILTHPTFLVTEPLQHPTRTFWSPGGHRVSNFAAADLRAMPTAVTRAVWWPPSLALVALAVAVAWWLRIGRPNDPLWGTAALAAATGIAYALVAWHFDGMEAPRHTLVGWTSVRIAVLLVVAAVLAHRTASAEPGAEPDPSDASGSDAVTDNESDGALNAPPSAR